MFASLTDKRLGPTHARLHRYRITALFVGRASMPFRLTYSLPSALPAPLIASPAGVRCPLWPLFELQDHVYAARQTCLFSFVKNQKLYSILLR